MKPRNIHAYAPIMRKGGVHEKSNSAKRGQARQALKAEIKSEFKNIKATNGRLDSFWDLMQQKFG